MRVLFLKEKQAFQITILTAFWWQKQRTSCFPLTEGKSPFKHRKTKGLSTAWKPEPAPADSQVGSPCPARMLCPQALAALSLPLKHGPADCRGLQGPRSTGVRLLHRTLVLASRLGFESTQGDHAELTGIWPLAESPFLIKATLGGGKRGNKQRVPFPSSGRKTRDSTQRRHRQAVSEQNGNGSHLSSHCSGCMNLFSLLITPILWLRKLRHKQVNTLPRMTEPGVRVSRRTGI